MRPLVSVMLLAVAVAIAVRIVAAAGDRRPSAHISSTAFNDYYHWIMLAENQSAEMTCQLDEPTADRPSAELSMRYQNGTAIQSARTVHRNDSAIVVSVHWSAPARILLDCYYGNWSIAEIEVVVDRTPGEPVDFECTSLTMVRIECVITVRPHVWPIREVVTMTYDETSVTGQCRWSGDRLTCYVDEVPPVVEFTFNVSLSNDLGSSSKLFTFNRTLAGKFGAQRNHTCMRDGC